ncbi:MAG: acylphosphatase [Eubacteriales bacterium]|nr:acylphosphatase [Eubacteriales bacterium]
MTRKHIVARGRVQGVGFRYICQSIASKYNVTGWIENKFDGSVEMEVQGLEHRVDLFIEEVKKGNRFVRVDSLAIHDIPSVNAIDERGFRVRY